VRRDWGSPPCHICAGIGLVQVPAGEPVLRQGDVCKQIVFLLQVAPPVPPEYPRSTVAGWVGEWMGG
jgi:hypothetical protein